MENFQQGAILTTRPTDFSLEKAHELLGSATARPAVMAPAKIQQVFQKNLPTCGAHASAHQRQVQEQTETGTPQHFSPKFNWKNIKLVDNFKPEEGTDMKSIFVCQAKDGACDYPLLPNLFTETLAEYTDPTELTQEMKNNAQPRIISSYAFCTDLSFENLKTQIYLNKAVLLLIQCDNGFFGTDTPTFTKRPYGHFVVATGYSPDGIYVQDSTEVEHPVKFIKNEYAPFILQAGTTIDLPDDVIQQMVLKISLLQKVVELWTKLKSLMK